MRQAEQRERAPVSALAYPIAALAILLAFNLLFTPGFRSIELRDGRLYGSLIDIAHRAAPVMLLALGMTLVIATRGVDLSVGAVMAIAGATAALLIRESAGSPIVILGVSLAAALIAGMWNGTLVAFFDIQPIVATLILMVAGRGIAQLLTSGQILTFEYTPLEYLGSGFFLRAPFTVTLVAVSYLISWLITRRTALALFIEAVGDNEIAARCAGLNPRSIKFAVYAFSGLCAGLAGLILAGDIKGADSNNAGLYLELDAILAVVIGGGTLDGGRFSFFGSIVGALIMQTLSTTILARGVAVEPTLVVKAIVVIAVCLMQSDALRSRIAIRATRGGP